MTSASLKGRVVAITGGARGIGLAIATALRQQGAQVCIGDLDAPRAAQAATAIGAESCALDVRDRASFNAFLAYARDRLGEIDVLINNAGIMPMGPFLDEDEALSDTQIDINLRGVIHGCRLALPAMLARGRGHIINVASLAGRFAIPGAAVYCGTKYAVVGFTESLREEFRGRGLHFTTVMPSRVSTELAAGTGNGAVPTATPEEVAEVVLYALRHRPAEVTAPRYLGPVPAIYALTPAWLTGAARRLLGDHLILTRLDRGARAGYQQRLDGLKQAAPRPRRKARA